MNIVPNPLVIALQVIPFIVTLVALNQIIFKPMLAWLEQRARAIEDGRREAVQYQNQATERTADYEQRLAGARAQVSQLLAKRRAEALAEYEALLKVARTDAEAEVTAAVARIGAERDLARSQLQGQASALASQISSQVLGRNVATG
jgi:F-type H+-transporting ATPase subunit b